MRLIPSPPGEITQGAVRFRGRSLLDLPEDKMRLLRGNEISMIFQEPMTALNPVYTVGDQIMEAIRLHQKVRKAEARKRAIEMLQHVGIASPEQRVDEYPHQLSGGMRQRVMIAMALSCHPAVLIADEPTTALDVTIQAQILDLLKKLQAEMGMAIILITHDLGVVAETADQVAVMYAGKIVEHASVGDLFGSPRHPYTIGLLESIPRMHERKKHLSVIPGTVPPPTAFPPGCSFHPRCPFIVERCRDTDPEFETSKAGHMVRCHRWRDVPDLRTEGVTFS
jgi:oligopeptide/dipeptide ABC transporter ATP-binding protein